MSSKFGQFAFSLHHLGNNKWIVKDADDHIWCGMEDGWVHENSSHMALDNDCYPNIFKWDSLGKFIKNNFDTDLK